MKKTNYTDMHAAERKLMELVVRYFKPEDFIIVPPTLKVCLALNEARHRLWHRTVQTDR